MRTDRPEAMKAAVQPSLPPAYQFFYDKLAFTSRPVRLASNRPTHCIRIFIILRHKLLFVGISAFLISKLPAAQANQTPTNSTLSRMILVDPSSASVGGGAKATLTIGALKREGGIYSGSYHVKVSPYFFKNENGKLAIVISDDSMRQVAKGKKVNVSGTATTTGDGQCRHIEAIATPTDDMRGTIKLWFLAGPKKIIFQSSYHFEEQ